MTSNDDKYLQRRDQQTNIKMLRVVDSVEIKLLFAKHQILHEI